MRRYCEIRNGMSYIFDREARACKKPKRYFWQSWRRTKARQRIFRSHILVRVSPRNPTKTWITYHNCSRLNLQASFRQESASQFVKPTPGSQDDEASKDRDLKVSLDYGFQGLDGCTTDAALRPVEVTKTRRYRSKGCSEKSLQGVISAELLSLRRPFHRS